MFEEHAHLVASTQESRPDLVEKERMGIQYVTLVNVLMNSAMYAVMMWSYLH